MRAEQTLLLRLAEQQVELRPVLQRLAEAAASRGERRRVARPSAQHRDASRAHQRGNDARPRRAGAGNPQRDPPPRAHHRRARRRSRSGPTAPWRYSSRRQRAGLNIWPGFVDALSQLVMVIVFVLLIFTAGQFYLTDALSGRDAALQKLTAQVNQLDRHPGARAPHQRQPDPQRDAAHRGASGGDAAARRADHPGEGSRRQGRRGAAEDSTAQAARSPRHRNPSRSSKDQIDLQVRQIASLQTTSRRCRRSAPISKPR